MRYSHFIAIGLVSLGCTITAIPFNGKPQIAKRVRPTVTATFGGCTAVCWDATSAIECDEVQCDQLQIPGPTPKPVLKDRVAITSDSQEPVVTTTVPAVKTSFMAVDSVLSSVFANQSCDESCAPEVDNKAICIVVCSDLTHLTEAPLTTSPAKLEARADAQARHAHEARLAGKFGLVPRDTTVTETVTIFPASCTVGPQGSAIQQASVALSEASAAIAQVVGGTAVAPVLPPAASAALSEASAFLSSIAVSPVPPFPLFANATVVAATASNPVVATSIINVSPIPLPTATSSISKGIAAEGKNPKGFFLMILTGLLGNVALMI